MAQVPPFASRIRPKTGKNGGRPGSGGIGGMPGGYARPQDNNRRGGRRGRWGLSCGAACLRHFYIADIYGAAGVGAAGVVGAAGAGAVVWAASGAGTGFGLICR